MMRKIRLPIVIICSITLISLVAVLGSKVLAQEGIGYGTAAGDRQVNPQAATTIVPGGPGFVSVSAFAFQPYSPSDQTQHDGQTLYCLTGNCVFDAEINLPNGATITKFVVYYFDNAESNLSAYLYRGQLNDNYAAVMASITSSGTETSNRYSETTSITTPVIDNQSNAYILEVWLPKSMNVCLIGMRVDYSYPSVLPVVQK